MTEGKQAGSRILELRISQFMRLRAVSIRPKERGAVVVSGRNAQGKSSLLAAIRAAAGGKKAHPKDPIRTGAPQAEVVTVYGHDGKPTLFVRLLFERDAEPRLIVEDADGVRIGRPQEAIDRLLGAVAFDPLEFVTPPGAKTPEAVAKAQREQLLQVLDIGLDVAAHDAARDEAFRSRTDVSRALKDADGKVKALGADESEPSHADVTSAANAVIEAEREDDRFRQNALLRERLQDRSDAIEKALADLKRQADVLREEQQKVLNERMSASLVAAEPRKHNLADARDALGRAQNTQGLVRAIALRNAERGAARQQADRLRLREHLLTEQLERMDREKAAAFAGAKMPVPGLTIDADGVKIAGPDGLPVPFAQASWAQKIVVSCRVAMAAHPDCNTMALGDGNALDADSFEALARIAEAEDYQLWIERVAEDVPGAIVIEDGAVAGTVPTEGEAA